MHYLSDLLRAESWKFLLALLFIIFVAALCCLGWTWGILYIDQVCKDPSHAGLIAGLTIGYVLPLGVAAGIISGADVLAEEW